MPGDVLCLYKARNGTLRYVYYMYQLLWFIINFTFSSKLMPKLILDFVNDSNNKFVRGNLSCLTLN